MPPLLQLQQLHDQEHEFIGLVQVGRLKPTLRTSCVSNGRRTESTPRHSSVVTICVESLSATPTIFLYTCSTIQIDQNDIDRGNVRNTVIVGATEPDETPVESSGAHLLPLPRRSEISLGESRLNQMPFRKMNL